MTPLVSALDRLDAVLADLDDRLDNGERIAAAAQVLARKDELRDAFRVMAATAAEACHAPFGGVTIVDDRHQTMVACTIGHRIVEGDHARDESFCQFVAGTGRSFLVEDSDLNPLVRNLPTALAQWMPVRAYYGSPIYSPGGWPLGSFCIADSEPRRWRTSELLLVDAYAAKVTEMLREERR